MLDKTANNFSDRLDRYFSALSDLLRGAETTDGAKRVIALAEAVEWVCRTARQSHQAGNKIMFVGNGGSAAICSHLAIDFSKNGHLRAIAFNDPSALTCLGNDFGYEYVFSKQIEFHGRPGDLLVAISSSGRSANILNAVRAARALRCNIVTFSGFSDDNDLRASGDMNFFVRSNQYGFVELAHLALCHAVLDIEMGGEK